MTSAAMCCGCIGIATRGDEVFRVDRPVLSADRARYVGSDPGGEFPVLTKDQVLAAWGKPDAIEAAKTVEVTTEETQQAGKDGVRLGRLLLWGEAGKAGVERQPRNERWIYKDGLRWKGVWLQIVIIPVPLMLPISTNRLAVEYSGDSVVAIETVNSAYSLTVCGLYWLLVPMCTGTRDITSNKTRFLSARQLQALNPAAWRSSALAGTAGTPGSSDGTGTAASFNRPRGLAADAAGNIYVADTNNHTIRKITPEGVVTTLAGMAGAKGSADGVGAAARFALPRGVAADGAGNVYVADSENHTIRKITRDGVVSTLAGSAGAAGNANGIGTTASFRNPSGVAADGAGNVYVADPGNRAIRKITPEGAVSRFAPWANSRFPLGVATDAAGNVYVADGASDAILKLTPDGIYGTLADRATAILAYPNGVATDRAGNVYVADTDNSAVRKITPGGAVIMLAGPETVDYPSSVAIDGAGNVYVADTKVSVIRKIAPAAAAGR